jgi:hypothetical protein
MFNQSLGLGVVCAVLFGWVTVHVAEAKPRVRPTTIRSPDGEGHYGVKATWTFRTVAPNNGGSGTHGAGGAQVSFDSLDAALRDPRVSAGDKVLIQREYAPKLAQFQREVASLNQEIRKDKSVSRVSADLKYQKKLKGLIEKYQRMHQGVIESSD